MIKKKISSTLMEQYEERIGEEEGGGGSLYIHRNHLTYVRRNVKRCHCRPAAEGNLTSDMNNNYPEKKKKKKKKKKKNKK